MLRWFLRRKLDAEERRLGGSLDYLRHIVATSTTAFLRFASVMPFSNSRATLPAEAWYTAQLVAVRQEDCGPCVQITVNLARQDGVNPALIRSLVDAEPGRLPKDVADVYAFALAVTRPDSDPDELRESLRARYGDRGLIELAYAIASGRIPPTVKRVLGYAKSCQHVVIET